MYDMIFFLNDIEFELKKKGLLKGRGLVNPLSVKEKHLACFVLMDTSGSHNLTFIILNLSVSTSLLIIKSTCCLK